LKSSQLPVLDALARACIVSYRVGVASRLTLERRHDLTQVKSREDFGIAIGNAFPNRLLSSRDESNSAKFHLLPLRCDCSGGGLGADWPP